MNESLWITKKASRLQEVLGPAEVATVGRLGRGLAVAFGACIAFGCGASHSEHNSSPNGHAEPAASPPSTSTSATERSPADLSSTVPPCDLGNESGGFRGHLVVLETRWVMTTDRFGPQAGPEDDAQYTSTDALDAGLAGWAERGGLEQFFVHGFDVPVEEVQATAARASAAGIANVIACHPQSPYVVTPDGRLMVEVAAE